MIIKIIGSGSAGNHIAYAFEQYAKKIYMFDLSKKELSRSKKIYISRYKKWNKNIIQSSNVSDQKFYDLAIISTPPSTHLNILKKNIQNSNNFLIEKPLSEPNDKTIESFSKIIKDYKNKNFFCGYNHRLFPSTQKLKKIIENQKTELDSIEVNFKENTGGFLKAHYWLKDLSKSYLSKYREGGGSLLEHSHGLNLAQYFCKEPSKLKIINKNIQFVKNKKVFYDTSSSLILNTNQNLVLVNQNFETLPIEKNVTVANKNIFARLIYNYQNNDDKIFFFNKKTKKLKTFKFIKKRSDDFRYEASFISNIIKNNTKIKDNPLDIKHAILTMKLIRKSFK